MEDRMNSVVNSEVQQAVGDSGSRSFFIDALKGIAILAVVLYHMGEAPFCYGYLGVDIFFVISGFFMMKGILKPTWTYKDFLFKKVDRLVPMVLLVSTVALIFGAIVMLPDDFENLSESVVATSFFANNILECITTKNYWDVSNEYKPLMHTWYIGVLVQAYIVMPPALLLSVRSVKNRNRTFFLVLGFLLISLILFAVPGFTAAQKFYYLPFRLYEILAGALIAFVPADWTGFRSGYLAKTAKILLVLVLVFLIFFPGEFIGNEIRLVTVVICSALVLLADIFDRVPGAGVFSKYFVRGFAYLGVMSLSIYLWHQTVLVVCRYLFNETSSLLSVSVFVAATAVLSVMTYRFIERKKTTSGTLLQSGKMIALIVLWFIALDSVAMWVYVNSGIIRDVPELDIVRSKRVSGLHNKYNHRIYEMNKEFTSDPRKKVLTVGNSFARDWANVLIEWDKNGSLEISYISPALKVNEEMLQERFRRAEVIFCSEGSGVDLLPEFVDKRSIYVIGDKDYGKSMGFYYTRRFCKKEDYFRQRAFPLKKTLESNQASKKLFAEKFIDMIACIQGPDGTVPVFTPENKYISQDCRHLTHSGAVYYAKVLSDRIAGIMNEVDVKRQNAMH